MRYTPGRLGSESTKDFASNGAVGALVGCLGVDSPVIVMCCAPAQQGERPSHDVLEHAPREAAFLGVVAGAMIGVQQHPPAADRVLGTVGKFAVAGLEAHRTQ